MRARIVAALLCTLGPLAVSAQQSSLSRLDACKTITVGDVSLAAKKKGLGFKQDGPLHCTFVVKVNDTTVQKYELYLLEVAVTDSILAARGANKGSPVSGIWNEAYIAPTDSIPDSISLVAVKKGDLAIRLDGPSTSKDVLISLGKLVATRIKYSAVVN